MYHHQHFLRNCKKNSDLSIATYFISYTTTLNIYSLVFRYSQLSTMITWAMLGIVAGLRSVSNSPITTNSFSYIARVKISGLFRPIYTYTIINSYIPRWVAIVVTSISPPIIVIITDITLLIFSKLPLYLTRKTGEVNNLPR